MTVDVINRLREWRAEDGSRANRRLAGVILQDIDFASRASIAELAARADVSEPTVTRFCRALGFEGMRDFKHMLAQVLALGGPYLNPQPLARGTEDDRIPRAVAEGAARAMELARGAADMAVIHRIGAALVESRQIVVFGSGGVSSLGAQEMQNRLFRLGLPVVAHSDGQMQRMAAAVCGPQTSVLAISVSGEAASIVESLCIARQYGARTVALTNPGSRLAREAEIFLPLVIPPEENLYKPSSGRYALLFLIDILATAAAERIGPPVLESLRRVRLALSTLNRSDPTRPIGD